MINDCKIYTIEHGWLDTKDVEEEMTVITLDGLEPKLSKVSYVESKYVSDFVNRIDSGSHNLYCTNENVHALLDSNNKIHRVSFEDIPELTPDKAYLDNKMLPLLSWPKDISTMNYNDVELESIARKILLGLEVSIDPWSFTGSDAIRLIDMLEFWLSDHPGSGWFGRAKVKSRAHKIKDFKLAYDLSVVAVLAGYTASIQESDKWTFLCVAFESTPIPGSRPKNEKWYRQFYSGEMYNIYADNNPILGNSLGRVFYLPFCI